MTQRTSILARALSGFLGALLGLQISGDPRLCLDHCFRGLSLAYLGFLWAPDFCDSETLLRTHIFNVSPSQRRVLSGQERSCLNNLEVQKRF